MPEFELLRQLPSFLHRLLGKLSVTYSAEDFAAQDYLTAWARRLSSDYAIKTLESLMELDNADPSVKADVLKIYAGWHELAKKQINTIEELFSDIAKDQQRLLVHRLSLATQIQNIEKQEKAGLLSEDDAERMIQQLSELLDKETVR